MLSKQHSRTQLIRVMNLVTKAMSIGPMNYETIGSICACLLSVCIYST